MLLRKWIAKNNIPLYITCTKYLKHKNNDTDVWLNIIQNIVLQKVQVYGI